MAANDVRQDAAWKRIVVSREWPADPQIQRMLREVSAMSPLWLVERPALGGGGYYVTGVITVYSFEHLLVLAHEYCNAHVDWAIDPDRYTLDSVTYGRIPEGRALLAAWEADLLTNDPLLLNSKDDPMVGPGVEGRPDLHPLQLRDSCTARMACLGGRTCGSACPTCMRGPRSGCIGGNRRAA